LDLDSRSSGCARLGGGVAPPLGVVVEEVLLIQGVECNYKNLQEADF